VYIEKFRNTSSNRHNYSYYISDILPSVFAEKFGTVNIALVGCVVLELNQQLISLYSREYVNFLLLQHDLWEIKLLSSAQVDNVTLRAVRRDNNTDTSTRGSYDFNRRFENVSPSNLKSINLEWDYENPCRYCGCMLYFVDETPSSRKKCCNNGKVFMQSNLYPQLLPLPPEWLRYCTTRTNHMGRNSVSYNYVLSLGSTKVQNESGEGGFESIHGDHSFLLHGRMYHCLPHRSSNTGGLYFFTYDAIQQMVNYGDRVLNKRDESGEVKYYRFYPDIARALYIELKITNYLVRDCVSIGEHVRQEADLHINLRTSVFEIASIISEDSNRPNRTVVYKLRNERKKLIEKITVVVA